jgi:(hydroxyamino)benzene mutase
MNSISQQLLISGTVLFLLSLLGGFAIPILANPRMNVSAHVAGIESGLALWGLGLMCHHLALPAGAERTEQIVAVGGLYTTFISLFLARCGAPVASRRLRAPVTKEVLCVKR